MCEKCCACLNKLAPFVPLLFRITLGVVFIQSGWGKLHNLEQVKSFFEQLHIPMANIQAPFVAGVEFVCGILVLIGLLTRFSAFMIAAIMIVATITAKAPSFASYSELLGIQEWDYFLMAFALMVSGAGCFSVSALICRWKSGCKK
jgi:putative oxidoreductase